MWPLGCLKQNQKAGWRYLRAWCPSHTCWDTSVLEVPAQALDLRGLQCNLLHMDKQDSIRPGPLHLVQECDTAIFRIVSRQRLHRTSFLPWFWQVRHPNSGRFSNYWGHARKCPEKRAGRSWKSMWLCLHARHLHCKCHHTFVWSFWWVSTDLIKLL